jgi:hypothetical protein
MQRTVRLAIAAGAVVSAMALTALPADAGPSPTLIPPPGCTGGWNTVQAAVHNHAAGVSRGCAVAISHKK